MLCMGDERESVLFRIPHKIGIVAIRRKEEMLL